MGRALPANHTNSYKLIRMLTNPNPGPPAHNNFGLIRLAAAIQVFIGHCFLFHFFPENWLSTVIWFIPGVPVFFGMSGFLLLWSYERNPDWLSYLRNRFLRLFPALWATMALTVLILLSFQIVPLRGVLEPSFLMYCIGRCTIIYSFTPAVVKGFATGNPNGSLWTIGIELQFYLILPLLAGLIRRQPLYVKNAFLISVAVISWLIDRHDPQPPFDVQHLNGYLQILVSEFRILYYLFFFIIGMLFYLNYQYLRKMIEGHFTAYFIFYTIISLITRYTCDLSSIDRYAPDALSLLRHIFLMFTVFAAATTRTGLSQKLLKGNDYSYGIYLTHLLMLNSFYHLNRFSGAWNAVLAGLCTGLLALLSWHLIEKPALSLKTRPTGALLRPRIASLSFIIKYLYE